MIKLKNNITLTVNELQGIYNTWREKGEEAVKDTDLYFTWDCGEMCAREDFSNYAGLKDTISFEDMLELEQNY